MSAVDFLALGVYCLGVYFVIHLLHRDTKFLDPLFRLMDKWRDG